MMLVYLPYSIFYTVVSGKTGLFFHLLCTWKNHLCILTTNSQHLQDAKQVPHVGYQGSTCWSWNPNLSSGPHVELCFDLSLFMGSILWLYQTQGLFFICELDTNRTKHSYDKCSWTAGHKKKILSFNLKSTVWLFYTLSLIISTWLRFYWV